MKPFSDNRRSRRSKIREYAEFGLFRQREVRPEPMVYPIKVWRKTPEQLAAYTPGMDLGEPDDIILPKPPTATTKRHNGYYGKNPDEKISKAEYLALRKQGLTQKAIAAAYDMHPSSISYRLRKWGLNDSSAERTAVESFTPTTKE
ncbi:hypothetical protein ACF3MZ_21390 [Paenibacillaceae bacterium WGS1546]|uniref:hypothetical protein n=1 Tax=Cohnella sp. WGS1546 TaxID=3366810 RepID=UPI00372D29A9